MAHKFHGPGLTLGELQLDRRQDSAAFLPLLLIIRHRGKKRVNFFKPQSSFTAGVFRVVSYVHIIMTTYYYLWVDSMVHLWMPLKHLFLQRRKSKILLTKQYLSVVCWRLSVIVSTGCVFLHRSIKVTKDHCH